MNKDLYLKSIIDGIDITVYFKEDSKELTDLNEKVREILSKKLKGNISKHFQYQFKHCSEEMCEEISSQIISDIFLKTYNINIKSFPVKFQYVFGLDNIILDVVNRNNYDHFINKQLFKIKHLFFHYK